MLALKPAKSNMPLTIIISFGILGLNLISQAVYRHKSRLSFCLINLLIIQTKKETKKWACRMRLVSMPYISILNAILFCWIIIRSKLYTRNTFLWHWKDGLSLRKLRNDRSWFSGLKEKRRQSNSWWTNIWFTKSKWKESKY